MTTTITEKASDRDLYPTRWRGDYAAKLTGSHGRYTFEREFGERGYRTDNGRKVYGVWIEGTGLFHVKVEGKARYAHRAFVDGRYVWTDCTEDVPALGKRLAPKVRRRMLRTAETITEWGAQCVLCGHEVEAFTTDGVASCDAHLNDLNPVEAPQPPADLDAPF